MKKIILGLMVAMMVTPAFADSSRWGGQRCNWYKAFTLNGETSTNYVHHCKWKFTIKDWNKVYVTYNGLLSNGEKITTKLKYMFPDSYKTWKTYGVNQKRADIYYEKHPGERL